MLVVVALICSLASLAKAKESNSNNAVLLTSLIIEKKTEKLKTEKPSKQMIQGPVPNQSPKSKSQTQTQVKRLELSQNSRLNQFKDKIKIIGNASRASN